MDTSTPNHSWTGTPFPTFLEFLWVLTRNPVPDRGLIQRIYSQIRLLGLDTRRLRATEQQVPIWWSSGLPVKFFQTIFYPQFMVKIPSNSCKQECFWLLWTEDVTLLAPTYFIKSNIFTVIFSYVLYIWSWLNFVSKFQQKLIHKFESIFWISISAENFLDQFLSSSFALIFIQKQQSLIFTIVDNNIGY
jgi:hypothetical protein